jgi:2-keto-3-deoxy-L-fuconate dehydrogenase
MWCNFSVNSFAIKVIATDINEKKLELEYAGVKGVVTRKLDVTNQKAIEKVAKELGEVNVLFNCAG